MSATKVRSEKGVIVLSLVFFMVFLGIMGTAIVTLNVAEHRGQNVYREERNVFYAAQSGLEYGIKRFLLSDVTNLADWSETVDVGGGMTAEVEMEIVGSNKVQISVNGGYGQLKKQLGTTITYIDVSEYAVYSGGQVQYVVTKSSIFGSEDPSLIYQNASIMPIFDLDELRSLAQPFGYYNPDLTVSSVFNFPANKMIFVENDLTFQSWNWFGRGHFTALGNVTFRSPWFPLSTQYGTVYQPNANSSFIAEKSLNIFGLGNRNLIGGIITAGDVLGSDKYQWPYLGRLHVFHDRSTIIYFMSNSLNGGPLIIEKSKWENFN